MRLETARLVIRSFEAHDAEPWIALVNDPEVGRFTPPSPPATLETFHGALARRQTMERERGFEDAIAKEFPQIQIVQKQYGMSDRSKAMAAAENILTAHPNLDGIFGSTEPSSIGTALALKSRGLAGKVKFVAFDAAEGMIEDLKNGTIDALVAQDPFRIGYEAVRTLVDKLNGKTPPKRIDLSAHVITKADLDKPEIKALLNPDVKKYLQ